MLFRSYANIANISNVSYSVNVANVSGIGNIATLNLDGNASNILYGNGVFGPDLGPQDVANANYANFAGNAYSVDGGNVVGNVGNAIFAYDAGNANIANIAYSVSGANVSGEVANANYATYSGTAYSVSGANVSGEVANANYATYSGNANIANVAYSVDGANVNGEVANANYSTYSNYAYFSNVAYNVDGANVNGEVANANYANVAGTAYSVDVGNVSGIGNIATINLDGNISNFLDGSGNWQTFNNIGNANYANFAGNAYSIDGANVSGEVANANYASYAGDVINAVQSNITSVGTLSDLSVNGNIITGNGIANSVTFITSNEGSNLTTVLGDFTFNSLRIDNKDDANIAIDNTTKDGFVLPWDAKIGRAHV